MSILLPLLIALMMLTMGLTLSKSDFQRVLVMPKAILVGFSCQLLLLPLLGLLITQGFNLSHELTIGFLVLCACPGGALSNYISFTAKGDMALSISLTLASSIVCVFSIPLVINLFQSLLGLNKDTIHLPLFETMKTIAMLTLAPISFGMLIKAKWPNISIKISETLSTTCSMLLILYVLNLWYLQKNAIVSSCSSIGIPVLLLVTLSSIITWTIGHFAELPINQKITLVIETSIQNSALAFMVTVVIMQNALYSIPTVFYSVAMFIPALVLIAIGRQANT